MDSLVIPATQEAKAGGLQVQGHPVQYSKALPQKVKHNKETNLTS